MNLSELARGVLHVESIKNKNMKRAKSKGTLFYSDDLNSKFHRIFKN